MQLYAGGELSMWWSRIVISIVLISSFYFPAIARAQSAQGTPAGGSSATPGAQATTAQKQSPASNPSAQATPGTTKLPDVAITATRITQPVSQIGTTTTVVGNQSIQDQKIEMTSDSLREVPGVQVTQSGGPGTITEVSIRGSNTSQVLTLLDGVEVNNGLTGSFDFANLTIDNISRLEVIRGAGGSLYGSSAIGGVINQISREGHGAPRFSLLSDGGNWKTQRQVASVSGSEGRLGYSGAVS